VTRYRTIVADPPWAYGATRYGFKGNGRAIDGDTVGKAFLPYAEMPTEAICALPVRDMAERDAHLYLWTTNRYLRDAYEVAKAWGFVVSKALVWCKPPHARPLGGTFGSATEFVLFCRRGTLASLSRTSQDWFEWPRGRHSQKPEAFLDLVESVSPGPYLEMFARRARFGWDYWGNESLGTAEFAA
jgi:N6-adenosine-specific RNA methylase IME4